MSQVRQRLSGILLLIKETMAILRTVQAYPFPHDPDDNLDYGFNFGLAVGETIANVIVQIIDPLTDAPPVVPSDMIISDVSWGETSVANMHGVTYWVTGGTPNKSYYIRCQITTDSSPTPRVITRTMRLLCAEQ